VKIGIMGAGAIGCYVGGRLALSGVDVVFIGRPSIADEVAQHGMRLTDYRGLDAKAPNARISTSLDDLSSRDVVIVTTKGGDTTTAGTQLRNVLGERTRIVSLQNGVRNASLLREALPQHRVLAAMIPFNVLRRGPGWFHQGTSGRIALEDGQDVVDALAKAGMPARIPRDINAVLWGKLLINLNNSVNALAGVPIKEMLMERRYRLVMAAAAEEAIDVVTKSGIHIELDPPLPARLVPKLLRLPNALFRFAARPMVRVDPQARSSMWDDLTRGRKTEIDNLNGEITRLGNAPINAAIVELVKAAEGKGSPGMSSHDLCARVGVKA
jgi:2-dehydropantoate 2-reductase